MLPWAAERYSQSMQSTALKTALLLFVSNLFMNTAWYGHLKWKPRTAIVAILLSWGIAFFEYCIAVPANRLGHSSYSAGQLKVLQEAMSLATFIIISQVLLGEPFTWRLAAGFGLILAGVAVAF